jgi:hypothetical protein
MMVAVTVFSPSASASDSPRCHFLAALGGEVILPYAHQRISSCRASGDSEVIASRNAATGEALASNVGIRAAATCLRGQ